MQHLWIDYRESSMQKLQVANNDSLSILLKRPQWRRASEMFVGADVQLSPGFFKKFYLWF